MATAPQPPRPPGEPPSPIQTSPPSVAFNPLNVPPTQAIYLQRNDVLNVQLLTNTPNVKVVAQYRYLTPQGEIKEGNAFSVPFSGQAGLQIPLYEAWLLSLNFLATNTAPPGQWVYAQLSVARGAVGTPALPVQGIIWEGPVSAVVANGWPGSPAKEATDGAGVIRSITGTTPAAGADINETVPTNRRWTLLGLTAALTTSATVANRFPGFALEDQTPSVWHIIHTSVAQPASQAIRYNFVPGQTFYNDAQTFQIIPAPTNSLLKSGYKIISATQGLQATDQWTAPVYVIQEWGLWDA